MQEQTTPPVSVRKRKREVEEVKKGESKMRPYLPSFNITPASSIEPTKGAST